MCIYYNPNKLKIIFHLHDSLSQNIISILSQYNQSLFDIKPTDVLSGKSSTHQRYRTI